MAIRHWLTELYDTTIEASRLSNSKSWLSYIQWAHPQLPPLLSVARRVLDWLFCVRGISTLPQIEGQPQAEGPQVSDDGAKPLWFDFASSVASSRDQAELLVLSASILFDTVRSIRYSQWPIGGPESDDE